MIFIHSNCLTTSAREAASQAAAAPPAARCCWRRQAWRKKARKPRLIVYVHINRVMTQTLAPEIALAIEHSRAAAPRTPRESDKFINAQ